MENIPQNTESLLDRVTYQTQTQIKKEFGVNALDLKVLKKIIPKEDLQSLVERYRKNLDLGSAWGRRIKPPKPEYRLLFQEHLSYPGKISDFAKEKKILPTECLRRLHLVAYYEYVVERKHLPVPKLQ